MLPAPLVRADGLVGRPRLGRGRRRPGLRPPGHRARRGGPDGVAAGVPAARRHRCVRAVGARPRRRCRRDRPGHRGGGVGGGRTRARRRRRRPGGHGRRGTATGRAGRQGRPRPARLGRPASRPGPSGPRRGRGRGRAGVPRAVQRPARVDRAVRRSAARLRGGHPAGRAGHPARRGGRAPDRAARPARGLRRAARGQPAARGRAGRRRRCLRRPAGLHLPHGHRRQRGAGHHRAGPRPGHRLRAAAGQPVPRGAQPRAGRRRGGVGDLGDGGPDHPVLGADRRHLPRRALPDGLDDLPGHRCGRGERRPGGHARRAHPAAGAARGVRAPAQRPSRARGRGRHVRPTGPARPAAVLAGRRRAARAVRRPGRAVPADHVREQRGRAAPPILREPPGRGRHRRAVRRPGPGSGDRRRAVDGRRADPLRVGAGRPARGGIGLGGRGAGRRVRRRPGRPGDHG